MKLSRRIAFKWVKDSWAWAAKDAYSTAKAKLTSAHLGAEVPLAKASESAMRLAHAAVDRSKEGLQSAQRSTAAVAQRVSSGQAAASMRQAAQACRRQAEETSIRAKESLAEASERVARAARQAATDARRASEQTRPTTGTTAASSQQRPLATEPPLWRWRTWAERSLGTCRGAGVKAWRALGEAPQRLGMRKRMPRWLLWLLATVLGGALARAALVGGVSAAAFGVITLLWGALSSALSAVAHAGARAVSEAPWARTAASSEPSSEGKASR
eukprot:RCo022401